MSWIVWIEIHDGIGMGSARDNKTFLIVQGWNVTERALHIVAIEWTILSSKIIKAMWRP
jgi:hypothetical protein